MRIGRVFSNFYVFLAIMGIIDHVTGFFVQILSKGMAVIYIRVFILQTIYQ